MEQKLSPIILCGGSGTRLWPLSRRKTPKQFIKISNQPSLFQKTLIRLYEDPAYTPPIVITNADYRFQITEQAQELDIPLEAVILEPASRNTAPAIAAASHFLMQKSGNKDALIHILPSDHLILDCDVYRDAISLAASTARDGNLVTFGIEPDKPATGYGYIKAGEALEGGANRVASFVEKPDIEAAQAMLTEGGYSWNSGMFLFEAKILLSELQVFEPKIVEYAKKSVEDAVLDLDFIRLEPDSFKQCPDISIDYALFERTQRAAVVAAAITWSDIGSWKSFYESSPHDTLSNVTIGDVSYNKATNNLVISEDQHIALNGVSNLAVVATNDAILISDMAGSEDIKEIVNALKVDPRTAKLTEEHTTILRPWGGYTSILNSKRFQVKKLFVTPGKKLSLQKHYHRAEHWVVVSGTAEVTVDEKIITLSENESVYIPLGAVHRLANPGKIQLEVIEVQSGSYLGEDDIIRLEDDFGRGRDY